MSYAGLPGLRCEGAATMRLQGRVTRWKDEKGFGFIALERGGDDIFLHISDLETRRKRPAVGDIVTFELSYDERRRKRARQVSFAGEEAAAIPSNPARIGFVAPLFLLLLGGASLLGKLPYFVPAVYLVLSGVTFAAYAGDKSAARNGEWRTSESALLLLGLLGGWPGALAAQQAYRHKTGKPAFLVPFWGTVAANLLVLALAFTPEGGQLLHSLGQ
jgi:uncharacterized membrane protein YsdA (DUF1294 family)/cold shock CspA family protein